MRDQSSRTGHPPLYPCVGETGSSPTRRTRALLTLVVLLFGAVAFVSAVAVRMFRHERWVHPEVQGFVRDASGKGIADVTVRIERSEYTDKSTTTDSEGRFALDAVAATVYVFPGDGVETTTLAFTRSG